MTEINSREDIDFRVDKNNLYREEGITDMKVASIRRLVPIKADGSDDPSRTPVFYGNTQLMTPEGPLPIQAQLAANNLEEAFAEFPNAMQAALSEMIEKIQKMQQEQKLQDRDDSRIIVPGR
jgi:hypothetical protein